MMYNLLAQQQNGWDNLRNPHHPHPVIPEPATYGVVFVGICIIICILLKYKRK